MYFEHFEKTPNFGCMVHTPKIFFWVLQIISRVLHVPIFRNNFRFGWKVFTFSKNLMFIRVICHKTLNVAIYVKNCISCIYMQMSWGHDIIFIPKVVFIPKVIFIHEVLLIFGIVFITDVISIYMSSSFLRSS